MELKVQGNRIIIDGSIKTITDAQTIIDALKNINSDTIILVINESFQIPSSVLGYLVKLYNEGKTISIETKSDILYELLDDLSLTSTLNVKKI